MKPTLSPHVHVYRFDNFEDYRTQLHTLQIAESLGVCRIINAIPNSKQAEHFGKSIIQVVSHEPEKEIFMEVEPDDVPDNADILCECDNTQSRFFQDHGCCEYCHYIL